MIAFILFVWPADFIRETPNTKNEDPPAEVVSAARIANPTEVRKRLGLSPGYDAVNGSANSLAEVRFAVLDYGFDGFDPAKGQLPAGTTVVEHYSEEFITKYQLGDPTQKKAFVPGNTHGRVMAQIAWSVTNFDPAGPKFYLLNANGPTMFRRAVRYAIEQKIHVVLFSGSFEGLGNFDGKGPLNAVVDEAVRAGIIWLNAAGNFGGKVYDGPVKVGPDGFLVFANNQTSLRVKNNLDENVLTVTLNWNAYQETEDAGTDKDLDLYIEDWDGRVVGKSENKQVLAAIDGVAVPAEEGSTKNPRERVVVSEPPRSSDRFYRIRIKAKSSNFQEGDRLRVLVSAAKEAPYVDPVTKRETYPVVLVDATQAGEVFPPADHPRVITVGDGSMGSSVGPTADRRVKPDFVLDDSEAVLTSGESSVGSSNAAAYFAGTAAVLKARYPGLRPIHLLSLAGKTNVGSGASTVAAKPTGNKIHPKNSSNPGVVISLAKAKQLPAGNAVTEVQKSAPNLSLWQAGDQHLIAGIDRSPALLGEHFASFPQDKLGRLVEDFEFYMSLPKQMKGGKPFTYFRRKTSTDPQPWTAQGGKAEEWLEVRRSIAGGGSTSVRMQTALARRVWKTPRPAELDRLLPGSARVAYEIEDIAVGLLGQAARASSDPGIQTNTSAQDQATTVTTTQPMGEARNMPPPLPMPPTPPVEVEDSKPDSTPTNPPGTPDNPPSTPDNPPGTPDNPPNSPPDSVPVPENVPMSSPKKSPPPPPMPPKKG